VSARHRESDGRSRPDAARRSGLRARGRERESVRRLFAGYAAVSLAAVLLLGAVLMWITNTQADSRGLAQVRTEASIIARVTVAPRLSGHDLRSGLSSDELVDLARSVSIALRDGDILRLRVRDLDGNVVFSSDSSLGGGPDDEALEAAQGEVVAELTHLNTDQNGQGARGPRVVEIYQPLNAAQFGDRIGVLELYVPYAPIAAEVAAAQHVLVIALSGGLLVLWLCLLVVSASVTGRLRRQASINAYLASHDALTELPNRAYFAERAQAALEAATAELHTAVAVFDLDRFKDVNDTLGHATGDELLITLGNRLAQGARKDDVVARLGGNEFAVVLTGLHGAGEAVERLSVLRAQLNQPVVAGGLPVTMEASVGFAMTPEDGPNVDVLLQRAELAMYVAKQKHLGIAHYRPAYETYDSCTLALMAELGTAIATDELVLHYQPKGDIHTGRVTAVEALVRWNHPTRGLLYPDAFVPAAEQTDLIDELTRWVVRTALTTLPSLDASGTLAVAINISARSLIRPDFADEMLGLLAGSGVAPARVSLELTETALLADPARAARTLARLHEAGLRVSIDDFGAGQTSLSYLVAFPISELKIDKVFVLSMLTDPRNAAIVRSVIDLGHSLGFAVTAEGVETAEALEQLTRYGCDTVQGFYLARPTPADALLAALHDTTELLAANAGALPAGSEPVPSR
jgi:diguanylate cyclase (GGDEF)-like protein